MCVLVCKHVEFDAKHVLINLRNTWHMSGTKNLPVPCFGIISCISKQRGQVAYEKWLDVIAMKRH